MSETKSSLKGYSKDPERQQQVIDACRAWRRRNPEEVQQGPLVHELALILQEDAQGCWPEGPSMTNYGRVITKIATDVDELDILEVKVRGKKRSRILSKELASPSDDTAPEEGKTPPVPTVLKPEDSDALVEELRSKLGGGPFDFQGICEVLFKWDPDSFPRSSSGQQNVRGVLDWLKQEKLLTSPSDGFHCFVPTEDGETALLQKQIKELQAELAGAKAARDEAVEDRNRFEAALDAIKFALSQRENLEEELRKRAAESQTRVAEVQASLTAATATQKVTQRKLDKALVRIGELEAEVGKALADIEGSVVIRPADFDELPEDMGMLRVFFDKAREQFFQNIVRLLKTQREVIGEVLDAVPSEDRDVLQLQIASATGWLDEFFED